jgi:diguanylate cyclase (GGDEF)-like protein
MEIVRRKVPEPPEKPDEPDTLLIDESTLKSSGLFGEASYCIPTLTFLSGEALGKELPLIQPQVTIGRGEESDVLIMDPSVSRKHVEFTCRKVMGKGHGENMTVVLRDLGSKNGTLVNYRKIRRAVLKPGDKICLGRVILKFEYRDLADQGYYDEVYRLATTDSLTAILNKATITRVLTEEASKKQRYGGKLSVILMDLDNFKSLNDTFGHLTGDRALQCVAAVLRRNLRRQDRAGRFGGEEFLVVLPETGMKGASESAERIRADIELSVSAALELQNPVTASLGVASFSAGAQEFENLVEKADNALYRAKAQGKNRVELWQETHQPGRSPQD